MKILGLWAFLFSASVFASSTYEISCGVTKQLTQGEYKISASVKGYLTVTADKEYLLEGYKVAYTIYADSSDEGEYVWAEETIKGDELKNSKYKPIKYKNHVKFELPSKSGKVDFIYPEKLGTKKKFKAHLVLTWIEDHFGGTAHVYCQREKVD